MIKMGMELSGLTLYNVWGIISPIILDIAYITPLCVRLLAYYCANYPLSSSAGGLVSTSLPQY